MSQQLLRRLQSTSMLCDGGMGTQLMALGLRPGECGELWNVERPRDVESIHRAYAQAGCELITTNTFGATTYALQRHGLADRAAEVNELGVRLLRRAVGGSAYLLGDIGPFGDFLEPMGETTEAELREIFLEQATSLKRGGADAIIIETMSDLNEMRIAIEAAKTVADWLVFATYAFNKPVDGDFRTMTGATVGEAMQTAKNAGADVIGANCGTSMDLDDYVLLAEKLITAAGAWPVIVQPNAGSPELVDGQMCHRATPADMAALVPRLLDAGVHVIGGCCGTTPAHLAAMKEAMQIPTSEED